MSKAAHTAADAGRMADETIEFRNRMMAKADFEAERAGNLENDLDAARAINADLVMALQEAIDVFEGMNDDEINVELLPRLRAALAAAKPTGAA